MRRHSARDVPRPSGRRTEIGGRRGRCFIRRFARSCVSYARAARPFDGHTGPEFLEEPSPEHAALIELRDRTRARMRELLRFFPEEPPGGFGENGPDFGPVVHPDDVRVAASVQLPLALSLDDDFPTESYGPVGLLREKCALLASAIEVYAGWRAYTSGESRPGGRASRRKFRRGRWRAWPSPSRRIGTWRGCSPTWRPAQARCRQAVEFQLGRRRRRFVACPPTSRHFGLRNIAKGAKARFDPAVHSGGCPVTTTATIQVPALKVTVPLAAAALPPRPRADGRARGRAGPRPGPGGRAR